MPSSPVEAVSQVNLLFQHRKINEIRSMATFHGRNRAAVGVQGPRVSHVRLLPSHQLVWIFQQSTSRQEQWLTVPRPALAPKMASN